MSDSEFASLIDDRGTPVRWKVATMLAAAALIVSVVLQVAKAGAKAERLDALTADVRDLKIKAATLDRIEARQEEMFRRLDAFESKVDRILERGAR